MFRVKFDKSDWFWSQSIAFTEPFKNGMPLDQSQWSRFLVLTKRSAASGDENDLSLGAFHYAKDSGNFGRNSNGKDRFGFF